MVAARHVTRGSDPAHRGVVTLELTPSGERLVARVTAWRHRELAQILGRLSPGDRDAVIGALEKLVAAAGDGHGVIGGLTRPAVL